MSVLQLIQKELDKRYRSPIHIVQLSWRGSITYGTNLEHSDQDLLVIYIPPPNHILGLQSAHHKDLKLKSDSGKEYDVARYPLTKFCQLAQNANPNVIESLFLRHTDYIYISEIGEQLHEIRDAFVSKKLRHSLGGYAHSQLKRLDVLNKDATENSKRMETIDQFGYDTKKAYHCIRLLNMGIEVLTEHTLHVFRPDREKLKNIRRGEYSHEWVVKEADRLMVLLDEAYIHSDLKHSADIKTINNFLMKTLMQYLNNHEKAEKLLKG